MEFPPTCYGMHDVDLDRRADLIMKGYLFEIGKANDENVGGRRGYHMTEGGYARTLANVADCAEIEQMGEVAEWIIDQIESSGDTPSNRRTRRFARKVVTEAGFPANRYLNSA